MVKDGALPNKSIFSNKSITQDRVFDFVSNKKRHRIAKLFFFFPEVQLSGLDNWIKVMDAISVFLVAETG